MKKAETPQILLIICTTAFILYIALHCFTSHLAYNTSAFDRRDALEITYLSEETAEAAQEGDTSIDTSAVAAKSSTSTSSSSSKKSSSSSSKKNNTPTKVTAGSAPININTAGRYELMRLPGVGEAAADKIIAYRDSNGSFSRIEDIMLVSSIGEKKFEKMRDFITVD